MTVILAPAIVYFQRTFLHNIVHHLYTMLDLRRLRLLTELNRRGTVHAVADALAYTPSAVSQGLQALERETGVRLLERTGRNVRLTDAGRALVARAERLLEQSAAAEAELAAVAGVVSGTLRVASFQSAMLNFVVPALEQLAREHPAVRVEVEDLEVEQSLAALRTGTLDLVLGDEYDGLPLPRPAGIEFEVLLAEDCRLLLPLDHPLARRRRVPIGQLHDARWASGAPGTSHRDSLIRACRQLGGFEPDIAHRSNDLLVLFSMVRSAGAVALIPDLAGAGTDPTLAVRPPAEGRVGRTVYALTRTGATRRPALRALLDNVRERAKMYA